MTSPLFALPTFGAAPWIGADHSFAGWVPNVSGHLSFSLIDAQGHDGVNHWSTSARSRVVALRCRRAAQDFPIRGNLLALIWKAIRQDFILVASSAAAATPFIRSGNAHHVDEEQGVLAGVVLILPDEDQEPSRSHKKAFLRSFDDLVAGAAYNLPGAVPASDLPDEILARLTATRDTVACYLMRFALFRTGEFRLWFDMSQFLGRDASLPLFAATPAELEAAEALPAQAYYFLKDVVHVHYHHDAHSDQLLPLVKLPTVATDDDLLRSERGWRLETLRGLAKVAAQYRQAGTHRSYKRALGIIAYADAFQVTLARLSRPRVMGAIHTIDDGITQYDFTHVRASIDAKDSYGETKAGEHLQLFAVMAGVILSATALWAGAVQIQPIICEPLKSAGDACPTFKPGTVVDIVNAIVAQPAQFIVGIVVFAFGVWFLFTRDVERIPFGSTIWSSLSAISKAIGASVYSATNRRLRLAQFARVSLLLSISGSLAWGALKLVPKQGAQSVPNPNQLIRKPTPTPLDAFEGHTPAESGLFVKSPISSQLREALGADYEEFLRLMEIQHPLKRDGVFYVTGWRPNSITNDGAYVMVDPITLHMEIGLRRADVLTVYRSAGGALKRPIELRTLLGGAATTDVMPIADAADICRSEQRGPGGRTILLSGALAGTQPCEYQVPLNAGQVLSFPPRQGKGLTLAARAPNGLSSTVNSALSARINGNYTLTLSFEHVPGGAADDRQLHPFFLRLDVK